MALRAGKRQGNSTLLAQDVALIFLSVLVAILLVRMDIIAGLIHSTRELEWIGSFVAGLFFTSVFTTAPAIAALGEIAQANHILPTAFFGAIGAVIGDLVIFRFVRDRFSEHLLALLKRKGGRRRTRHLLKLPWLRGLLFLLGGLIIASPFPDELGISLLGFSQIRLSRFIPLSFACNFLGICLIGFVAKALL